MITKSTVTTLLQKRNYKPRTVESYGGWFDRLVSHFHGRNVTELSPEDITSFFQHLKSKSKSDQTVRNAGSALRFIFREVLRNNQLADVVPVIKLNRPQAVIPTQDQIFAAIAEVTDDQLRTALKCIYGVGLELQEVLALHVKDLDFTTNRLRVVSQRSKTARDSPIPLFAIDELMAVVKEKRKSDYIFANSKGDKLDEKRIQRAWAKARTTKGLPAGIDIRSLRHAYILHMTMLGIQLRDVLLHLGLHNDQALTYYSNYCGEPAEISFSPADRIIHEIEPSSDAGSTSYVSPARIAALVEIKSGQFDFRKLILLLQELNSAASNSNNLSIAFLVRAIIDHVPPVFGCDKFAQVASNYAGTKSFKTNMGHLDNALRNIADSCLHSHIRRKEDTPNFIQVDFRSQLDQLLSEIIRIA